ncbi:hypothetical protein MKX01_012008 [Papaver californicum]|nr:hypothetical protein MKX01_012008 [Papaver californicum]
MSGTRCTQFGLLCVHMGMMPKKLQLDVKHRWNSTYLMLKDVIPYRQVLSAFLTDMAYAHAITDSDWEHAELLCAFLKPFYDATNFFSGIHYVTSNSVLQYLYEIGMVFKNNRDNPFFKATIAAMEEKFVKYRGNTPILFGLGSILDPCLNLRGVETTLSDIEECFGTSAYSIQCHGDQSRLMDAKMKSLFAEYMNILHGKQVNTISSGPPTSTSNLGTSVGPMHSGSSAEGSSTSSGGSFWAARRLHKRDPLATSSEELKRDYAEPEPALNDIENFDVLDWWKSNEKRYPVLSCIARDVLAVQASTVASESAFSLGNRILGDYRSNLTPDMLECSVILKDWWKADMKEIYNPFDPMHDDITPVDELERLATKSRRSLLS